VSAAGPHIHVDVKLGADVASRGILACNAAAFEAVLPVVREIAEERGFRSAPPT